VNISFVADANSLPIRSKRSTMKQLGACPSCDAPTSLISLRCEHCGAFVRDRVPALNLFSTLWGVLVSPDATLLRIARSEQKNYTHVLFALLGPGILAATLFTSHAADIGWHFAKMLLFIYAGGPVFSLLLFPLLALMLCKFVLRSVYAHMRYRDVAAMLAYALSPLACASVAVLPLLLGVFGEVLFSMQAPAWKYKPLPFFLLAGVITVAISWSLYLLLRMFRPYGLDMRGHIFVAACIIAVLAVSLAIAVAIVDMFT